MTTIEAVARSLDVPAGALLKAFPMVIDGGEMQLVIVRGDHRVNEIKLRNALGGRSAPRAPTRSRSGSGRRASSARSEPSCRSCSTRGRRRPGGLRDRRQRARCPPARVQPGRDFAFERVDVREVVAGDTVTRRRDPDRAGDRGRQHLQARHPLLEPLGATYLDETASQRLDGSYGFGPHGPPPRPSSSSPTSTASPGRAPSRRSTSSSSCSASPAPRSARSPTPCTASCRRRAQMLYDDRDAGPGEKFADAELLGCPLRLTVGRRTLAAGEIEVQVRRGRESRAVPLRAPRGGGRALARPAVRRRSQAPTVRDRPVRAAAAATRSDQP